MTLRTSQIKEKWQRPAYSKKYTCPICQGSTVRDIDGVEIECDCCNGLGSVSLKILREYNDDYQSSM